MLHFQIKDFSHRCGNFIHSVTSSRLLYFPPTKLNYYNSGSGISLTSPDLSKIPGGVTNIYRTLLFARHSFKCFMCNNKQGGRMLSWRERQERNFEVGYIGSNPHSAIYITCVIWSIFILYLSFLLCEKELIVILALWGREGSCDD